MSIIVILLISIVILALGYIFYGSWLAKNGESILIVRLLPIRTTTARTSFRQTPQF